MYFNTAVERIGFPLAVLLYENELPEDLWQTITAEQCFQLLRTEKISKDTLEKAKAKASAILVHADFATAKAWYLSSRKLINTSFWEWYRQGYAKMKETASTFADWRDISDIVSAEYNKSTYHSSESRDRHDNEQRDIAQHLYPLASTRDEWAYLSQFSGPYCCNLGKKRIVNFAGQLSKEQYLEVAKRLFVDNPTEDEILRLGHRFPPQHPHHTQMVELQTSRCTEKCDLRALGLLYKELSGYSNYRAPIREAVEKLVESGKIEVRDGMPALRFISDLATDCGDDDFANLLYSFVVHHADEVPDGSAAGVYKWIVDWSDPESEIYKKFLPLIPEPKHRGRPRKRKEEAEV